MSRNANEQAQPVVETLVLETEEAVKIAAQAASDKKAEEIAVLDLREVASFTEFFLICTGTNPKQVQAIVDAIEEQLRKAGKRPLHIEGYTNAEWILMDYGDFLVHAFNGTARRFYDLERLWRDAPRVEVAV